MALRERFVRENMPGSVAGNGAEPTNGQQTFQEMKSRLHRVLINRMDLTKLTSLTPEQLNGEGINARRALLAWRGQRR